MIKTGKLCDMINQTSHKETRRWTGAQAWTSARVYYVLEKEGYVNLVRSKAEPYRIIYGTPVWPHKITVELIEKVLTGKNWKDYPEVKL